ncbi:hypothetical protein [Rhodococcus koreensis]|uniref:hypothetical protein n=1 Tax=Rhodococcus koreensis TaxID=99653 RepID=UPI001F12793D|nr:hypothetical protein [Rhodococcus koreensis]
MRSRRSEPPASPKFLGVKVAGLWTLEYDDEHLPDLGGNEWGEPAAGGDRSLHTLDPIALARAFSEGGRGYISRARAVTARFPRQRTPSRPPGGDWRSSATRRCAANSTTARRRPAGSGPEQPELIDAVLASAETIGAARD